MAAAESFSLLPQLGANLRFRASAAAVLQCNVYYFGALDYGALDFGGIYRFMYICKRLQVSFLFVNDC